LFLPLSSANDPQTAAAEDLSITKIAGLTWKEWNARLALPLVAAMCEGPHPLMFPRDLSINPIDIDREQRERSKSPNLNVTSGGEFACPDCGRAYKLKSSLRNHQKWECGKDPQFQCPYCVYRAKQKMHIGRHMERMHKERYYKVEGDKVIALDEPNMNCHNMDLNAINMNINSAV
jgi:hypothetical protein